MGFDILSLQRGRGTAPRSKADEGKAVLKYIDVDDLEPSEDNFYSMSAIDELAALIELSGGVKQPGLVSPLGGGKYRLISGHRRRLASIRLVRQGKEQYRKMPCMVEDPAREPGPDADELRAIDEAILLITTNGQREKTDWDKVQEATRLRALLEQKRRFEKIPGETRKIIAEQLGTTPAQIGRYDSIEKHLLPAFKDWLEQGKIGISVAYELSMMNPWEQAVALDQAKHMKCAPSIEDVKRWREELRAPKEPPAPPVTPELDQPAPVEREAPAPATPGKKPEPPKGAYMREEKTAMSGLGCEPPAVENDGKIVDFPAPSPSPPAPVEREPDQEPKAPERMSGRQAANILEDLQMYCEEMLAVEPGLADTWAERADALMVAIATLRK